MSEKRFTVKSIKNNHYQIAENDLKMLSNEVVDYMNLSSDAIGSLQKKMVEQQDTIQSLEEENEQLRKENTALDNENAEHLADNIRELELLEKLTKFLQVCDLTDEQRALFHEMITEEDLQH